MQFFNLIRYLKSSLIRIMCFFSFFFFFSFGKILNLLKNTYLCYTPLEYLYFSISILIIIVVVTIGTNITLFDHYCLVNYTYTPMNLSYGKDTHERTKLIKYLKINKGISTEFYFPCKEGTKCLNH